MSRPERLALMNALRSYREANHLTQDDAARALGISRKTYLLFETTRWLPPAREWAHFAKKLHELTPALARAFTEAVGIELADQVLVVAPPAPAAPPAPPVLGPAEAKRAYDVAIYEACEELDVTPGTVRPMIAVILAKLGGTELTLKQAAALAAAPRKKSPP